MGLTGRQLVLFFSEGVVFSSFETTALSLFQENGTLKNASLGCSTATRGRGNSWREIVLHLDEPCTTSNASSWGLNDTSSSDGNVSLAYVGGYPSDWDKLVEVGVLPAEAGGATDGGVVLNATSEFVTDLSAAANALVAVTSLKEHSPGEGTQKQCHRFILKIKNVFSPRSLVDLVGALAKRNALLQLRLRVSREMLEVIFCAYKPFL